MIAVRAIHGVAVAAAISFSLGTAAQPGRACAIDGVPSLRADGAPVILNRTQPTSASLAHWAPFVFARVFHLGQSVRLSEDLRELVRTLPPEMVQGRWLWRTGDGGRVEGRTANHRYNRPGTYLISVGVELPAHRGAFIFDSALLTVR